MRRLIAVLFAVLLALLSSKYAARCFRTSGRDTEISIVSPEFVHTNPRRPCFELLMLPD